MQAHELLKPWHELQADSSERLDDIPWLAPRAKIGPGNNPITVDANGQFESTVLFQQGEHPTWKSWDLTKLTQKWVTTPSSNNGVILWATNEDVNAYDLRFYSSENETKPPELMIIWSDQPKTVYFLKDHLGSIRATVLDSAGAPVVAYDDYDPWGYLLAGRTKKRTWSDSQAVAKNKFTGKEWDDEYSVNWLHFPYRSYDPEIGRWLVRDPLEMKYPSLSPYVYAANNPVNVIDIDGDSTFVVANDNGTYTVTGGNLSGAEDDTGIYTRDADGNLVLVGQSITTHSFFDDDGKAVVDAIIDPTSYEGALFVLGEVVGGDPTLLGYMQRFIPRSA
ncbi:RHS repeat-associated core domain-containing protein [candidate division KSB1 bacterium]|nr:MAG: RHS repeat-associated core domain-containing protein [candidate division KSB1 bacterium]